MSLGLGDRVIGATLGEQAPPRPFMVYDQPDAAAIIADFAKRLVDLEKAVKLSVPIDKIISMIALTNDTILIAADKIGVIGEVTFADWHRDVSGSATGIDPSITQIRGGVIKTGVVSNLNGTSYVNLDATTTGQTFIQCASALSIMADGQFTFGSSTGKKLIWDGVDLSLGNSSLLGSTAVSTVVSGAASGAAYPGDFTASILANSGTAITVTSSTLFSMGSGLAGVFIGAGGLYGKNSSGATTFSINGSTGAPWFGGDIETSGRLVADGAYNASTGLAAAITGKTVTDVGVLGYLANSSGATGTAIYGLAPYGTAAQLDSVHSYALKFRGKIQDTVSGLEATGLGNSTGFIPLSNGTMCTNLNAEYVSGIYFGSTTTGAATATFTSTNKPGSNTANTWAPVVNTSGSTLGYIPVWT